MPIAPYQLSGNIAEEQMYRRARRERLLHPSLPVRVWWWIASLFIVELAWALVVTNIKDFQMWMLWDDRAVAVEKNTGEHLMFPGLLERE